MAITRISQSSVKEGLEKYTSFYGGYSGVFGEYESIATLVVTSASVSELVIGNIPNTYQHLQIRITARTARALHVDGANLTFNGDTGANYTTYWLYGDGASVLTSTTISAADGIGIARLAGNNATSNLFGSCIIDILDYSSSTKTKTIRVLGGTDNNGQGEIHFDSGMWNNLNPISFIRFKSFVNLNFLQHTNVCVYGIKA